jgi:hypothetical protein
MLTLLDPVFRVLLAAFACQLCVTWSDYGNPGYRLIVSNATLSLTEIHNQTSITAVSK